MAAFQVIIEGFRKPTYDESLTAVRNSNTPIYVTSMLLTLRDVMQSYGPADTMSKIELEARIKRAYGDCPSVRRTILCSK